MQAQAKKTKAATKRAEATKPRRHEATKTTGAARRQQPIDAVEWIDPAALHANDYNPNRVFGPEMKLLRQSILDCGWTQPIVARRDGEIIDGFHRWTLATGDADIRAMTGGLCPVVFVEDLSREQQMIATVRHNRARGQHGVLRMAEIVRSLADSGMGEAMIAGALQMEDEEVTRLIDARESPQQAGKDHFGKGWAPTR